MGKLLLPGFGGGFGFCYALFGEDGVVPTVRTVSIEEGPVTAPHFFAIKCTGNIL
jgi:hypothetical protein